jgi:hypothetical protein
MRAAKSSFTIIGAFAILALVAFGATGCGATTVIRQTVIVSPTFAPTTLPTATSHLPMPTSPVSRASTPPPGIWCPIKQGQTPLVAACEIYPSPPQLYNPSQGETTLAGRQIGPRIGSNGVPTATETMNNPWAADVDCATNDNTNSGEAQIIMVAHTSGGDYYSWGDQSCGPPAAPSYGHEYFRKASGSMTLSIKPLTGNLASWYATFIQL